MRRSEREIVGINNIADVLRRADTIRLALHDEPYPYVVPLSFGLEVVNEKIALYFHGARDGLKHELIAKNPHVCVESDIFYAYMESINGLTTEYESVVGFGSCEVIAGAQAAYAMEQILAHCGYEGYIYDPSALDTAAVYKITLDSVRGKRNLRD